MDAASWHHWCTHSNTPAPKPWKPDGLRAAADGERQDYANRVYTYLRNHPVESPIHTRTETTLSQAAQDVYAEPLGARTMLALTAPFSAGKSTLVKTWAAENYRRWCGKQLTTPRPRWNPPSMPDVEADLIPVVYLNLQSDTKSKDLYVQILRYLGRSVNGDIGTLAMAAAKAFSTHGVRLLVIDDAHMLRTHLTKGRATLDAIKATATELGEAGGMLLLVGAWTQSRDLLEDPQIQGRLDLHEFSVYGSDSESQRQDWQLYLRYWELALCPYLPELPHGLLTSRWAGRILSRTQGYLGDATACLAAATRQALSQERLTLVEADLDAARLSKRALVAKSLQASPQRPGPQKPRQRRAG